MHISVTDLTLPVNALLIAALLVYLQDHFFKTPFIKDRCVYQYTVASLVTLIALTVLMIQHAIEIILGLVDPGPVVIIVVLLIIAILLILILQNAAPALKKAKALPVLKKFRDILSKIQAGGKADGLDEKDRADLQKGIDELLQQMDDTPVDPNAFSEDEKKLIRDLLKQLEEDAKSPNLPDPLKKAIEKLIEKLKGLK